MKIIFVSVILVSSYSCYLWLLCFVIITIAIVCVCVSCSVLVFYHRDFQCCYYIPISFFPLPVLVQVWARVEGRFHVAAG